MFDEMTRADIFALGVGVGIVVLSVLLLVGCYFVLRKGGVDDDDLPPMVIQRRRPPVHR